MTTKDLIFVANLILDCEEKLHEGHQPILEYVRDRCRFYRIPEVEDYVLKIIGLCAPVYNIGTVTQDYVADSSEKIT